MGEVVRNIAQVVMMGVEGFTPSQDARRLIERGIGGVILYERNCRHPSQVAELIHGLQTVALCRGPGIPLLVAIDQEHGPVTRIKEGVTPFPSPSDLGARGDVDLMRRMARITGRELALMGINMNLAPVADLRLHPQNQVIGKRSFGSDPHVVGALVTAYIEGLQGEGVAACAKHFPGHGATSKDSHHELPTIERSREEMEGAEFIPFQKAVRAGVAAVMTGHLSCPALGPRCPATLSPVIIEGLLRRALGFKGMVISDDLNMGALSQCGTVEDRGVEALISGVDLLLVGEGKVDGLLDVLERAIGTGTIPLARVAEAVYRISRVKEHYPYRGPGDLKALRREEDLVFSQELFQGVKDGEGDPGDRKA